MKHDPLMSPEIVVYAPQMISDIVLGQRLSVLKDRFPDLKVQLNPKNTPTHVAVIVLGVSPSPQPGMINRKVGTLTSKMYRNKSTDTLNLLPDMIAGLRCDHAIADVTQRSVVNDLYLSVDPSLRNIPGVRQTLDWVESCVSSLAWLNDPRHV